MNAKKLLAAVGVAWMSAAALGAGEPTITMHRVQQRYPWNGKIDIDYTVENVPAGSEADYYVRFKITENGRTHILHEMLDSSMLAEASNGTYRVTWDSARESDEYHFFDKHADFKGELVYCGLDRSSVPYGDTYVIVDLGEGASATSYPVSYRKCSYQTAIETFNTTEYKTTKLVLREIVAGTFMMGSPTTEWGREPANYTQTYGSGCPFGEETQHQVTLTQNYLIGIFPITQAQYYNITGAKPSKAGAMDDRPVENVSYQTIRGSSKGIARPATFGNTDAGSFCGILSAKTGLTFDLPTEAEWEYACRAGTTTSTYVGDTTQGTAVSVVSKILQFGADWKGFTYAVGQKQPNAWALYDTLGNVWEWCRDRVSNAKTNRDDPTSDPVTDPLRNSGDNVVDRGSCFSGEAANIRAAIRGGDGTVTTADKYYGFRISARVP